MLGTSSVLAPRATDTPRAVGVAVFALGATTYTAMYVIQPMFATVGDDFGIGTGLASGYLSITTLLFALLAPAFVRVGERWGRARLLFFGSVIACLACLFSGFATQWWQMAGLRALVGIGLAAVPGAIIAWIHASVPPERVPNVTGSYVAGTAFGGMAGRLLGGWLTEFFGWNTSLLVIGAGLALITVVALGPVLRMAWKNKEKDADGEPKALPIPRGTERWRFLLFIIGAGSVGVFLGGFNILVAQLTGPDHMLGPGITSLFFLTYLIGVFIGPAIGSITRRIGARRTLLIAGALTAMGTIPLGSDHLVVVTIAAVTMSLGFFVTHATCNAWLSADSANPSRATSSYTLWYYLGSSVGGFVASLLWEEFALPGFLAWQLCIMAAVLIATFFLPRQIQAYATTSHHSTLPTSPTTAQP